MKIDRDNYEIYFIDYLDGNLSLDEIDLLLDFLNENPELKEELKGLELIKIEECNDVIPAFNYLRKSDFDHPEIFEETCIRAIENDLNANEKELFSRHLYNHPEHQKEFQLFQATISEPDPFILFENKHQLKKKPKLFLSYVWYAAAVIILGLCMFFPTRRIHIKTPGFQVAQVVTPIVTDKPVVKNGISIQLQPATIKAVVQPITPSKRQNVVIKSNIAEAIEPLTPITVSVTPMISDLKDIALVPVIDPFTIRPKSSSKYLTIPEYFASKADEAEKRGAFGKFALNTLRRLSGDKFDYSTTSDGKIEKLEFNSKLLAFTIPLDN